MDWVDERYYYRVCLKCGKLYPVYKIESWGLIYLGAKCKCERG